MNITSATLRAAIEAETFEYGDDVPMRAGLRDVAWDGVAERLGLASGLDVAEVMELTEGDLEQAARLLSAEASE